MLHTLGQIDNSAKQHLQQLLDDHICQSVSFAETVESTNAWALTEISSLAAEQLPRLYFTDRQTSGRGRHGRSWHSSDQALAFSLVVDWPVTDDRCGRLLSLAVGVGIAQAIEFQCAPLRASLKWPNDVYVDGGKVAGVLIETNQACVDRVVIGVGINVNAAPQHETLLNESDKAIIAPPRSLSGVTGRQQSRHELLVTSVTQMVQQLSELQAGEDTVINEFRARCLLSGHDVGVTAGADQIRGHCEGITDEGYLAIATSQGTRRISSGEANRVRKIT